MSEAKELTLQEVAEHSTKKDLYLIINDKVYDCTTFANEHPYVVSISITAESRIPIPEAKEQALARVEEKSEKKKKATSTYCLHSSRIASPTHIKPQNHQANQSNSGGEEVLLDLAGQDCTEAFDDVGHSDEARALLDDGMFVGNVKRLVRTPSYIHPSPHTPYFPIYTKVTRNTNTVEKIAR